MTQPHFSTISAQTDAEIKLLAELAFYEILPQMAMACEEVVSVALDGTNEIAPSRLFDEAGKPHDLTNGAERLMHQMWMHHIEENHPSLMGKSLGAATAAVSDLMFNRGGAARVFSCLPRVYIHVDGGVVQEVISDTAPAIYTIVDFDNINDSNEDGDGPEAFLAQSIAKPSPNDVDELVQQVRDACETNARLAANGA